MFCPNCGYQVNDGVQFCPNCGNVIASGGNPYEAANNNPYAQQQPQAQPTGYGAANNNPYAQQQQPQAQAQPAGYGAAAGAPEPPAGYNAPQNPYDANSPYGGASYGGYVANGSPVPPAQPIQAAPPKKSKLPIIIVIAVVAVAAVVAAVFFMNRGAEPSGSNTGGVSIHAPASGGGNSGGNSGTGSTTAPSNGSYSSLEDYFDKNPAEWDTIMSMISAAESSDYKLNLNVVDNEIREVMRFNKGLSNSEIEELRKQFETDSSIDGLKDQLKSILQLVETSTGLSGLSWYIEYQDANGTNIWSTTITS